MKKETLEEAAKRTYQKGLQDDIDLSFYDGVRLGAKWQAERMYSKEEVNNMFNILKNNSINNVATISNVDLFIDSWKKQFKKK